MTSGVGCSSKLEYGAWGSNPPGPACRAGALPESEPRARGWGSRESNTERAPYQRAQVTVPSYPDPSCNPRGAGGGSRTHTDPLLRRMPSAFGLRRRARVGTGPGDRTLRGPVCDTGAFTSSLVPLCLPFRRGLGGGIRTPDLRRPRPTLCQVEPHPGDVSCVRSRRRESSPRGRPHESRPSPRVVAVAGVGIAPTGTRL